MARKRAAHQAEGHETQQRRRRKLLRVQLARGRDHISADPCHRDEDMGDPAEGYRFFERPAAAAAAPQQRPGGGGGPAAAFAARQYAEAAARCSAPARLGERHAPPACYSIEADCRAAWAALQPDHRNMTYPSQRIDLEASQFSRWGDPFAGGAGVQRGEDGGYDALPPGDEMHDDAGCSGGLRAAGAATWAGPPYAPQSTERRRRPRRKWDASVNYERITRRLELRFDAVAAEAPTTPPAQPPPQTQRPAARVLSFGGAGIEPPMSRGGSPGETGGLHMLPAAFPLRQQAARPMSGVQARCSALLSCSQQKFLARGTAATNWTVHPWSMCSVTLKPLTRPPLGCRPRC